MPFFGASGTIAGEPVTLAPSAARTTTGSGGAVPMGSSHTLRLTLSVTAVTGTTPSMTVTVEHSADASTWVAHSAFTAATTTTTQRKVFSGLDRFVRATWAITGTTPSFTFDVTGEQV